MTLLSAEQDFGVRTLAAFRDPLSRLAYFAELRAADGRYTHWGVARAHGEEAAQRAMASTHSRAFLELLRFPLPDLLLAVRQAAAREGQPLQEVVAGLRRDFQKLVPTDQGGGCPQHLSSVLTALAALEQARASATVPAA